MAASPNGQDDAAHDLALAVTTARLSSRPTDHAAIEKYAAAVLGEIPACPPPHDSSPGAQLAWTTSELTAIMTWLEGLPDALARLCTACADISVAAVCELASVKQSSAAAELQAAAARALAGQARQRGDVPTAAGHD